MNKNTLTSLSLLRNKCDPFFSIGRNISQQYSYVMLLNKQKYHCGKASSNKQAVVVSKDDASWTQKTNPFHMDQKLLFTPGPLNTSYVTKQAMLTDWGSRGSFFINVVKKVRQDLLKIVSFIQT